MNDFFGLMGPLDKTWCDIFLIFGIFSLILLIVNFFVHLKDLMKDKNKGEAIVKFVLHLIYPFLFYIIYRMLYQLCVKVL